jgi:hypothetical protein
MSSIWTPGGERPVGPPSADELTTDEQELLAELQAAREQLSRTPASLVVANHAIGLFQLAAIHLDQEAPNLEDARLAIDAFGALVEGCRGRLGEEEDALVEALAQIRLAFVKVSEQG